MGTSEFGVPTLNQIANNFNLLAIVTNHDKPSGRGLKIRNSTIKEYAIKKYIELLQPKNLKDPNFVEKIKKFKPDFLIVVAFRMLPKVIWSIPNLGTINLHASLLPNYRGAAPINWALINGEKYTGVTTFFIDDKIDTGDILLQKRIKINKSDNTVIYHSINCFIY
jgi:methionyl-tRNA formyltransferase